MRPPMSSRVPIAIAVVVALAVGAAVVTWRAAAREARDLASRLTGCPAADITVEMMHFGDTESWHIDGCGIRGTLTCEPTDPGCYIVPDTP